MKIFFSLPTLFNLLYSTTSKMSSSELPQNRMEFPQPAHSTIIKNSKRTPRPKNSFMVYRMEKQHTIRSEHPGLNSRDISRLVGEMWREERGHVKELYQKKAALLRIHHRELYPNYKFSPKKRSLKKKSKKSAKKEARFPMEEASSKNNIRTPSSSDNTIIQDDITSTTSNDYSGILSFPDTDTISIKEEEPMDVSYCEYETTNLDNPGVYTPLEYIHHDIPHEEELGCFGHLTKEELYEQWVKYES